jgi:hypothetical protein
VDSVRAAHPGFTVNVLNPDLDADPRLSHTPVYYAPALPAHARIYSCDQSPFESVHILSGGDVVVCEVHDEVSLGNLATQSLREIWSGERYREFRRRYVAGAVPECRTCVWKLAYVPERWTTAVIVADGMSPQLLRGWHSHEGAGVIWSKKEALVVLANPERKKQIRIAGTLPQGEGAPNSLRIACNRQPVREVENRSEGFVRIDDRIELPEAWDSLYLELSTARLFRPSVHGPSSDSRDLGVGLERIEVCD